MNWTSQAQAQYSQARTLPIQVGRHRCVEVLGSGTSATVYRTDENLALKVYELNSINSTLQKALWSDEFSALEALRENRSPEPKELSAPPEASLDGVSKQAQEAQTQNNFICQMQIEDFDCSNAFDGNRQSFQVAYLAQELCERGELFDLVERQTFDDNLVRHCAQQLLTALCRAHAQKFCHLDLKLENVLITKNYTLRLADWGYAQRLRASNELISKFVGSIGYMMPQIHQKQPFSGEKADLFALGVCLYVMRTGTFPWTEASSDDFYWKLISNFNEDLFFSYQKKRTGDALSPELENLLVKLWRSELTSSEALAHPFLLQTNTGFDGREALRSIYEKSLN